MFVLLGSSVEQPNISSGARWVKTESVSPTHFLLSNKDPDIFSSKYVSPNRPPLCKNWKTDKFHNRQKYGWFNKIDNHQCILQEGVERDSCFPQELLQSVKRPTPPAALQEDGEYHHGDAGDHHDDALGAQAPQRIACATTASTTSGKRWASTS